MGQETSQTQPQPGDLIEIKRSVFYQHWAIYVGNGYIIHVTDVGPRDVFLSFSYVTGNAMVKKELLDDVAKPEAWEVNNKYDRDHTPLPVEQIIQKAENLVGTEFRYNLLLNNCEQLVTLLRYDDKISDQVKRAVTYIPSALLGTVLLIIITSRWIKFLAKKRARINPGIPKEENLQNEEREIEVHNEEGEIGFQNEEREIGFQNEEKEVHDGVTEQVALPTTEILDTLS